MRNAEKGPEEGGYTPLAARPLERGFCITTTFTNVFVVVVVMLLVCQDAGLERGRHAHRRSGSAFLRLLQQGARAPQLSAGQRYGGGEAQSQCATCSVHRFCRPTEPFWRVPLLVLCLCGAPLQSMNVQNVSAVLTVDGLATAATTPRLDFVLTPGCCSVLSPSVRLNGNDWEIGRDGTLPVIRYHTNEGLATTLPPYAVAFFVFPDANAPACM